MSEQDTPNNDTDDVYVIEDTGESLEDFSVSGIQPASEAPQAIASPADLQSAKDEVAAMRDQLLRSRADFDNFRKRAEREKSDFFRFAISDVARDLLPVVDNFERALSAEVQNVEDFKTGVEMIYKQLTDLLQKIGLKEVEGGEKFDPTIHEAVMREERSDVPSHTVLQTFQKGYTLHDRLIRPALVKVAVGGPEATAPAEDVDGDDDESQG